MIACNEFCRVKAFVWPDEEKSDRINGPALLSTLKVDVRLSVRRSVRAFDFLSRFQPHLDGKGGGGRLSETKGDRRWPEEKEQEKGKKRMSIRRSTSFNVRRRCNNCSGSRLMK